MASERVDGLDEGDEVARDERGALVDQLVEGMLAVGPRLAPVDGTGGVVDLRSLEGHVLAVALHRQLLQIGRESLQVLLVRQHGDGLGTEEIHVPHPEKPHQHRQVLLERGGAEVLVHLMKAVEHGCGSCSGPMASIVERPMAESIE